MKVKKEDLKKGKFKLTITVEPAEIVKYYKLTYDNLAKDVKIAGFRAGKAPRKMIEESVGITRLLSESLDSIIQQQYVLAIQEEKMISVGPPKVTISKYPNWGLEISEIESELVFEAEVEVLPEVKLKDFSKVKVAKKESQKITEGDVEKIMLHLRRQKATFTEIDRPAKTGDRTEISYQGSINKVKKDSMSAKNHPVILGENTLIPGFEDQVIGMKKDEEKKFEIEFPKDYHSREFAGKKAEFEVTLVDIKEVNLPEADDAFAANFGHKNIADLTDAIRKSLKDEVETKARQELESEVLEKVLPFLTVEVPDGLVDQEIDRMVTNMSEQIESKGMKLDKYLESIKKTLPELRKDMCQVAEKNIRIGFLLGKVIEQEKIDAKNPEAGRIALDSIIKKVTK
ncbi:MAG: trigger factor [Candidatus Berkelbacteria bacterium]|nr:trigger factor [Candidatus Berkelbacteria bacterium]